MVGDKKLIIIRYYNANYYATVIVASVREGVDWAVYIGGADNKVTKNQAASYVSRFGCKMSEKDARHYLPEIELHYRD